MYCKAKLLKNVKEGECFTLRDVSNRLYVPDSIVYFRGKYDRTYKKYECVKATDFCDIHLYKGDKIVYTDFTY